MSRVVNYVEFLMLCGEFEISPDLALETTEIVDAIKNNATYDELKKVFEESF
jgi:hypothetical protein